ncbi:MAG TPA: MFS transporter [Limnochordia bacterium]|nr:MFS transporter [Limnochordia bacterium]
MSLASGFTQLPVATRRLLWTRAARSLGQGILVVDFALYLDALGWSAAAIGAILGAGSLFSAAVSLVIGAVSDRSGRRPFLIAYEILVAVAGLVATLTPHPWLLGAAAIAGSFGRGANGGAGPFAPVEQAWLAEAITPQQRGRVFALNTAIGSVGMGVGAVLAGLVPLWDGVLTGPNAYRPFFAVVLAANLLNVIILSRTPGGEARPRRAPQSPTESRQLAATTRSENSDLLKLVVTNLINGTAIGLFGPLTSYWFAVRFGVDAAAIGSMFAATFFLTGAAALGIGQLSGRIGIVRSVVILRLIGVVLLALMPLAPWYWLAATLYVARSVLNRGTGAPRQALTVGLVRNERRGLATSLNTASLRLPSGLGPALSGLMIAHGELALPWYLGAGLQAVYAWLYSRLFAGREVKDAPAERSGSDRKVSTEPQRAEAQQG